VQGTDTGLGLLSDGGRHIHPKKHAFDKKSIHKGREFYLQKHLKCV